MPASVPLWFPGGAPEGVLRITDPDAIHKKVQAAIKDLVDQRWRKMAPLADRIARGQRPWWKRLFSGSFEVGPKWLVHALYEPKKWSTGLSQDDMLTLELLRRVRDMGYYTTDPLTREDLLNAPSPAQLRAALKMMVSDFDSTLSRMWASYNDTLYQVGREIEPLCDQAFGEPCAPGEGAMVAAGDVATAMKTNAFRGVLKPTGRRALAAFLRIYDRA